MPETDLYRSRLMRGRFGGCDVWSTPGPSPTSLSRSNPNESPDRTLPLFSTYLKPFAFYCPALHLARTRRDTNWSSADQEDELLRYHLCVNEGFLHHQVHPSPDYFVENRWGHCAEQLPAFVLEQIEDRSLSLWGSR